MKISFIGGPLAGQTRNVDPINGDPPEAVLGGDPVTPTAYRVHRCNDPFNEAWWWAYIAEGFYPDEISQEQIEASRPEEPNA